jgi:hypothetical protein|tara:strand:- start:127 stop:348 length:222 start_codon:yes stop_codon:yes gene_type:complete
MRDIMLDHLEKLAGGEYSSVHDMVDGLADDSNSAPESNYYYRYELRDGMYGQYIQESRQYRNEMPVYSGIKYI